jgi:Icc protein
MTTAVLHLDPEGGVLRIVQVTDTHLEQQRGGTLLGMDTDESLAHVLSLARAGAEPPDLLLATGDIANHACAEAYARAREAFEALGVPWAWLPGNHDEFGPMQRVLGRGEPMVRAVRTPHWQVLLLDSSVPGEVGGRLGPDELALLERLLLEEPALHALVCLHHQPVPVGCAWLDEQMVADAEAFFAVLRRHPQVRMVLWGHVHQEFAGERDGIALRATPSSCIQFAPASAGFRVDEQSPGLRWLELSPDGSVATQVSRVQGVAFSFDRDSAGYL